MLCCTDQEYTSGAGGKICFPAWCSCLRKRLSSRNEGLVTSSLRGPSHDSCRYSISNASRSFCSGLSFSTHFALSNLVVGADAEAAGAAAESLALLNIEAVGVAAAFVAIAAVVVAEVDDCDGIGDVSSFTVDGEEGGAADDEGAEELEAEVT